MKVLLQRVNYASVKVDELVISEINKGLLLLTGFGEGDDDSKLKPMAEKIVNMRIFPDEKSRFHFSLLDIDGSVLVVPQFTLFADTGKGRRPEFLKALKPQLARSLMDKFVCIFEQLGIKDVLSGQFGAYMKVELENDGPVTIMLEN
ncbi:MAG: D-tyrosyl-tRNA(Tyr) deacylase [Nitrospinae bacterium]|nr:D-tyrosyl-tRNA(Tyr) deacylase [Nitrospinota bacterium]